MTAFDFMDESWAGPVEGAGEVARGGMRLTDLSRRRRSGIKGPGAPAWLVDQGLPTPAENNSCVMAEEKFLLARLSPQDIVLLAVGDGGGKILDNLEACLQRDRPAGCYSSPRQDMSAWFRIIGESASAMMARFCAVDLRPAHFRDGAIAQTCVALQNTIVIRDDQFGGVGFHLLTAFTGAAYLWRTIADHISADSDT